MTGKIGRTDQRRENLTGSIRDGDEIIQRGPNMELEILYTGCIWWGNKRDNTCECEREMAVKRFEDGAGCLEA